MLLYGLLLHENHIPTTILATKAGIVVSSRHPAAVFKVNLSYWPLKGWILNFAAIIVNLEGYP